MKVLFVINPKAGNDGANNWTAEIEKHFEQGENKHHLLMMTSNAKEDLKLELDQLKPDRVIAVGGDGTLKFVAEQLAYSGIPIGFLPAGSANSMARELHLPKDMAGCLSVATGEKTILVDAVEINGHFSIHLADIGLNAELIKFFDEGSVRGLWGYAKETLRVLRNRRKMRIYLKTKDSNMRQKASMVLIANGSTYGTGVIVNPKANLMDGKFEIIFISEVSIWTLLKGFAYGRTDERVIQAIISVEEMEITLRHAAHFQVDGEYIGMTKRVKAHVLKGAVKLITCQD